MRPNIGHSPQGRTLTNDIEPRLPTKHDANQNQQRHEGKAMKYFVTTTNEWSDFVVVYAKNKFAARAMLNDDCEFLDAVTAKSAKLLIARGFRLIK